MILSRILPKSSPQSIEPVIRNHGDLLFDLCQSVLWSSQDAQHAFRSILKGLQRTRANGAPAFKEYERAWVLRLACDQLRSRHFRSPRKLTASEQLELDAAMGVQQRLRRFDGYFHRLPLDDQLILLLHDKYGIPFSEVAAIMGTPEGSLKVWRQQALRALEDWIWGISP